MKEYLIKKGNHYASGLHFGVHFGLTEQKYKVRFSKECLYTPDWENDWNKLCGWSYGLHHKNSIRAVWRPEVIDNQVTGKIELGLYLYENGIRVICSVTKTVNVEEDFTLALKYYDYEFARLFVNEEGFGISVTFKPSWGYRLYPYIGGDNVAVQDTKIYLERL